MIYWDAQQELGNFKGDFSLKIRGSKYIPFVTFKNINENFAIKRGQSFDIHWETPAKTREVKLNILRYGVPVDEAQIISNTGKHTWDIPDRLPAGKGYAIQIADAENTMHEETSLTFAVRRKIPLGYKIIPVAAVAGATLILLSDNGSNNKSGIPEPPSPPQR
ncbi:MAG: hypothetical protein HC819_19630 [Cyclobacteriaceae bacterium]|nr:hypothetical protein [Cyclobacteriaceae bacterium]